MGASSRVFTGARWAALAITASALLLAQGTAASAASGADGGWGALAGRSSVSQSGAGSDIARPAHPAGQVHAMADVPKLEDCRTELDGEGTLDPTLLEACMLVWPDLASTPGYDESTDLWFEAYMSGPTTNSASVEVLLDTTGDGLADYGIAAPSMPNVETDAPYWAPIYRIQGLSATPTGEAAAWWRVSAGASGYDGYLMGLDWRALKLTQVSFNLLVAADDSNWRSVLPIDAFSALHKLPGAPSAPRSVTASAGDRRATVRWARPLSAGASAITAYTVTSVPGGRTCVTKSTSCVVTGLSNQRSYRFQVRAHNAAGVSPWSALSRPVVPKPYTQVIVKPKSKHSKLKVDVNPNKGSGYWTFTVQKRTAAGTWSKVGSYRTKGKKETRTINLPKGTYRVVVGAKYGYQATVSGSVSLKK